MIDDDLLPSEPTPIRKRGPGRPTIYESEILRAEREANPPTVKLMTFEEIRQGVPISWLSTLFRMDHTTCRARLRECPKVGVIKGNTPLYDFLQAAPYLVRAKIDLKTLRKSDLPLDLQDSLWAALLKKQKWEEKAGHLWRTSAVLRVLSETFLLIKNTVTLWSEDPRLNKFTAEQRTAFVELADGLLREINEALVEQSKEKATRSQIAELEAEESDEDFV